MATQAPETVEQLTHDEWELPPAAAEAEAAPHHAYFDADGAEVDING